MASGRVIEIRVHGVSGTPPHSMLGVARSGVVRDTSSGVDDVWRRAGQADDGVRAFGWSNLTSGPPRTAWWILLLPYMLVNLAGWARPPGAGVRIRSFEAALRLTGLAVTMIFALVAGIGLIEIGGVAILNGELELPLRASLTVGSAATLLMVAVLWVAASRGDARQPAASDAPYLRPLHTAVAIWCVWWLLELLAAERGLPALIGFGAPALAVPAVAAAIVVAATMSAADRAAGVAGHALMWLTLAALATDAVALYTEVGPATTIRAQPLVSTIGAFAVLAAASVALGWSRRSPEVGPTIATLLALAGSMGASMGAGSLWVATLPFPMIISEPVVQIAQTFTAGVAAVAAVLGGLVAWSAVARESIEESAWRSAVRVRDRAGVLLWMVPAVTGAMAVLTVAAVRAGTSPRWPAPASAVLAVLGATGLMAGLARMGTVRAAGAVAALAVAAGISIAAADLAFTSVAVGVSLVVPLSFVLARLRSGLTDREARRALAVPWDVGSYFGRRFHPFAPPGYRDRAVAGLADLVRHHRSSGDVVVLGGHSQGSVIAAAALLRVDAGPGTAFLTYGSPLRSLYARFFPAFFGDEAFRQLADRIDGRWVNIWRETDPVAAPIAVVPVHDECWDEHRGVGHDGYWLVGGFDALVRRLGADAGAGPTPRHPAGEGTVDP
jgi:hypothetical protein